MTTKITNKKCRKCLIYKKSSEMAVSGYKKLDGSRSVKTLCKECDKKRNGERYLKNKEYILEKCKYYREKNYAIQKPTRDAYNKRTEERRWEYKINKRFGISKDVFFELFNKQNGLCAICLNPQMQKNRFRLSIDHNHKTGIVRGLLCDNCNRGLGLFKDSVVSLERAIKYISNNENNITNNS